MKKMLASLLAATAIAGAMAAMAPDASAQWRGRGWGWGWHGPGPGIAAGIVGGAIVAGAIIASRPPGYVVYEGYAEPVYAPGCYWASQPVMDPAGRVVGYTGQPVQVCPGYAPPPPGYAGGPPPGYAGGPPPGYAGGPPPGYAGGPPPGAPPARYAGPPGGGEAWCAQRYRSYDPKSHTFMGTDGIRHPCP